MNTQEARAAFRSDRAMLEMRGLSWEPGAEPASYLTDEMRRDYRVAMDAQFTPTTDPNSSLPMMFTTTVDPKVYRVIFAKNKGADILGEVRKGSWLDDTVLFPVVEYTGEVSSYGDYAMNGRAGVNMNWPARQSYLFQVIKEYGERELERAGLGRINFQAEVDMAAANALAKYLNFTYHFGVQGLENYGLLNDPNLTAALTPGTKAAGGVTWFTAGGAPNATANEVYDDIVALFALLTEQTSGTVSKDDPMVLVMSPASAVGLTFANTYGVFVEDLLKKGFPKLKVESDILYGAQGATNPFGVAAGNFMQLIASEIDGQETGFCAFNERMRAHVIVREMSAYKQKMTAGTWGAVYRMPVAVASMVGI